MNQLIFLRTILRLLFCRFLYQFSLGETDTFYSTDRINRNIYLLPRSAYLTGTCVCNAAKYSFKVILPFISSMYRMSGSTCVVLNVATSSLSNNNSLINDIIFKFCSVLNTGIEPIHECYFIVPRTKELNMQFGNR